ncbi:MAG: alpha/beta hydrolase [Elusimicrobia bacterium]|nr:alpha/beta hydrolase [Elusimicrobiota bacterium]
MKKMFFRLTKYTLIIFLILLFLLIAGAGLRLLYVPKLQPWHTFVPSELTAAELDKASWQDYIDRENKIFDDVYNKVVLKTPSSDKDLINRYYEGSRIYPPHFKEDWNRSYLLVPDKPKGAVVLLHGLTDSPYSLRHIARLYYQKGFVVVGLRTPGHGTVPGALTAITWQQWTAAARLAVREARKLSPEGTPLHIVGFSQGGALAVKYALDSLDNDNLSRPDKLVLISPMIGITRFSKLAEIIGIPSHIPGFEKAAWLSIIPEFNPFKYNSFPINAVKQARLLIAEMRRQIIKMYKNGRLQEFPPVIAFQSITDYTVSTPALINDFFAYLPDNGSELVLFDINRDTEFLPLVRPVFINMATKMLPDLPQRYRITVIGNAAAGDAVVAEQSVPPGGKESKTRKLGLVYPHDVFSLSHISLPFPESDALYGSSPDTGTKDEFGLNLGLISNAQGERSVLEINTNLFFRISSNPLFAYIAERLNGIAGPSSPPEKSSTREYADTKSKITEGEYDTIVQDIDYNGGPF